MKINPYIFRGYDIRGIVDKDLNPKLMESIGQAHGTYLQSIGVDKAVVGSDNRLKSEEYRKAIIKGLQETGIDTIDLGMSLSPIVYWAQYRYKSKGAVMVTGSHNPVEFDGLKLGRDYSDTLTPIQEIKKIVEEENFTQGQGRVEVADPKHVKEFYNDLIKRVGKIKKFKVLIDASNSTAGKFYPELLRRAGCEVIEQNCNLDGTFPSGTPDPTEEKVAKRVADGVLREKADVGFSYDSDGDRIGIVDENGGIIWNDVLVAIFADDVLSKNPGAPIVFNNLCSEIVPDVIEKAGGKPIMWLTGHAFIKDKARDEKVPFAGELSGHFFFLDKFYGHDDAGYASLRLLEYLTSKNKTLSQVVDGFPKYISSPEIKVGCGDDIKFDVVRKITETIKKDFNNEKISIFDDPLKDVYVRVDFKDGMMIVRPSQNGPYLTVKFEAQDQETYEKRRQYVKNLLHKYPEIDWEKDAANSEILK